MKRTVAVAVAVPATVVAFAVASFVVVVVPAGLSFLTGVVVEIRFASEQDFRELSDFREPGHFRELSHSTFQT